MHTIEVSWIRSLNLIGFAAAESLQDALKQLYLIDAIDENGSITSFGRVMAGKRFSFQLFSIMIVVNVISL
jgi:HrpA-like RNA helicase